MLFPPRFSSEAVRVSESFARCTNQIESCATDDETHVSLEYLWGNYAHLEAHADEIDTIAEVGCYMGGLTSVLADLAVRKQRRLYLVDCKLSNLAYTWHRMVALYPEVRPLLRDFYGTLPDFASEAAAELAGKRAYVILDTLHTFDNALREFTATWPIETLFSP